MVKPEDQNGVADLEGLRRRKTDTAVRRMSQQPEVDSSYFVGRLGGNGVAVASRVSSNEELLKDIPDAAPLMSVSDLLNLRPLKKLGLWKSALMEGVGTMMIVWLTVYASSSPNVIPEPPTPRWGPFNNAAFLGPLLGGVLNFMLLTLFTFTFGGVSGAHLNPMITVATFFARLCSLPRAILYISFQTGGGALGGLLARAAYGSRDFKSGGCFLFPEVVQVREAFVIEFMASTIVLFFAFGVGLDPRQRQIIGPTLGPFLVGLAVASVSLATGFAKYGYGGASMNPARCFGAYVGSRFPEFHWTHWVADLAAVALHSVCYHIVPPWKEQVTLD